LEESHFLWLSTCDLGRMNEGIAPYVDRSEEMGLSRSSWGWDIRFGDFNNDGELEALQATGFMRGEINRWPELHELAMGNDQLLSSAQSWPRFQPGDDVSGHGHDPFFVRASDGRYYDLAAEIGLDQPHISRGIATADVDGDGRLDFAVANQWEPSFFYRNESDDAGSFLGLKLILPLPGQVIGMPVEQQGCQPTNKKGRPAIGACATVYLPDGRRLVGQVDGGSGHSGKKSPDLHFGLGAVSPQEKLRVDLRWRNSAGGVMEQTLYLSQGWHTVKLG
jgi:enediyne biosynthesis protein E4